MKSCAAFAVLLIFGLLSVLGCASAGGARQVRVRTIEVSDADYSPAFILNVAKGTIEKLPEGAKTEQEMLEAFRKTGDVVYDDAIRIASGRCVVLDSQRIAKLAGKKPSDVTEMREMVEKVKQGDYLLIQKIDGGHAILYLKAVRGNQDVTLSWVENSGGDAPFSEEEITAILEVGQPRHAKAETGVAIIRNRRSNEATTVFSFKEGKAKPFPHKERFIGDPKEELQEYFTLLTNAADISYRTYGDRLKTVYVVNGAFLGRGTLEDFAGRDIATNITYLRDSIGHELVPGTIMAIRDRAGKYGMIRIESATTNELKFQWAYLPDGSSVFPAIAPLPDAVPTVVEKPPVRDIKEETQARLISLIGRSAGMGANDVKAEFQKIMVDGADVNQADSKGSSPLGLAAAIGSLPLVELMIGANAKINESGALVRAAKAGRLDMCKLLIDKGADRSYCFRGEQTAFQAATRSSHSNPDVWRICLPEDKTKWTIHNAALFGENELLKQLISQGSDLNGYDFSGKTPLMLAAEEGHVTACEILLEAGADVEKGNEVKRDILPVFIAVKKGQIEVARILSKHASLKQNGDGVYEAMRIKRRDIAEAIIESAKDASALYRDAHDRLDSVLREGNIDLYSLFKIKDVVLPLWAAAAVGDTNAIAKAIAAGVNIDQAGTDFWHETPLQAAILCSQYEAAKLLLSAGADPSRPMPNRGDRNTPLLASASEGNEKLMALLLQAKADANVGDHQGCTPLYYAVTKGFVPIVRLLLESGADPNILPNWRKREGDPYTLIERARGNKEIIQLLREHGAK